MKQPELGKKIAELRKSRRLTQEELVDRCNISVRTIQRIESGEVTPRDYTVKTILAALEYDLDDINIEHPKEEAENANWFKEYFTIPNHTSTDKILRQLNIAWILGILYFVLRFFEGMAEYSRFYDLSLFSEIGYAVIKVALVIAFVFFQRGFLIIGALYDNYLLKMISSLLIVLSPLIIALDLFSIFYDTIPIEPVILTYALTYGVTGLVFGYALTRLSKGLGRMPKFAGIIEIVAACFSLTVVFSFMGPITLIPAELLEVMILYRVTELVKSQHHS